MLAGRRGVRRRRWTAAARHRRWPTGWSPPAGPAGRCRTGCRRTSPSSWADRDLYAARHRAAYTGLAGDRATPAWRASPTPSTSGCCAPEGWAAVRGHRRRPCAALRDAGVQVAVVSNIGFDIRPLFAAWGLADLVDAFALSYEVGRCKPDPAIFRAAPAACSASTRSGR